MWGETKDKDVHWLAEMMSARFFLLELVEWSCLCCFLLAVWKPGTEEVCMWDLVVPWKPLYHVNLLSLMVSRSVHALSPTQPVQVLVKGRLTNFWRRSTTPQVGPGIPKWSREGVRLRNLCGTTGWT